MSDIQRRIVTLFDVRGSDRVRTSLGQMSSGFSNLRRNMDMGARSTGAINSELRALGTTLRYGIAGAGVYGTIALVRNLGEFQAKLGEIQSIASGPGGVPLLDSQIDRLGTRLIDVSNKTSQPIADLQEGVLNLYSTIGDVPPDEAAKMMETISRVAITSQSDIESTTQALLGLLNAFGEGTDQLGKFGDEFKRVIQLSAGMSGSQYAGKLGVLSQSASLARFTPEQMGALAVGATRFGGSSATNMTYLSQLMTYLVNPTTAKEKAAFAGIGLNQQQLRTLPGWQILQTVLTAVNKRGGVGISPALASASDETLSMMDEQGLTGSQAGLTGGGAALLQQLFGRMQSRRMAAVLSRLQTPDQVRGTKNQTLDEYLNSISHSAGDVDSAMARAMDYRRIVQATNAMHNFGVEIGSAVSPLLQIPARAAIWATSGFNNQHWQVPIGLPGHNIGHTPGQTVEVAGGLLGIAGLLRMLSRRGAGAGRLARGVPFAMAGMDAISGDTARGHSPLNPLYVAVVWSMANGFGGGGRGGIAGAIRNAPEGTIISESRPNYYRAGEDGRVNRPSRRNRFARGGLGVIGALSGAYLAYDVYNQERAQVHAAQHDPLALLHLGMQHRFGVHIPFVGTVGGGYAYQQAGFSGQERSVIGAYRQHKISGDEAERRLRLLASKSQFEQAGIGRLYGKADVNVTITDKQGNRRGGAHVPVEFFPDFTAPAPQTRGKPVNRRGNK
jgi:hypothetical protein